MSKSNKDCIGVVKKIGADRPPCKRPATSPDGGTVNSKRPKQPASSQLLQQLMRGSAAWVLDGGGTAPKPPPPLPGESVLMNLLVSGCDVSAGYICLGSGKGRGGTKVTGPS